MGEPFNENFKRHLLEIQYHPLTCQGLFIHWTACIKLTPLLSTEWCWQVKLHPRSKHFLSEVTGHVVSRCNHLGSQHHDLPVVASDQELPPVIQGIWFLNIFDGMFTCAGLSHIWKKHPWTHRAKWKPHAGARVERLCTVRLSWAVSKSFWEYCRRRQWDRETSARKGKTVDRCWW